MKKQILLILTIIYLASVSSARAQVAGNPPYVLEQSAIVSGGETSASAGNAFALTGTIGQSIAGTTSTGNPFAVTSGFWTVPSLVPTAAGVLGRGQNSNQ